MSGVKDVSQGGLGATAWVRVAKPKKSEAIPEVSETVKSNTLVCSDGPAMEAENFSEDQKSVAYSYSYSSGTISEEHEDLSLGNNIDLSQ